MRRFLADALLVLMLVSLATYITEPKEKKEIDQKIAEFEDDVARHDRVEQKVEDTRLNEIHENGAARLAQSSSEAVIDLMHGSMDVLSQFFMGFQR